jgi:hypothetical protein
MEPIIMPYPLDDNNDEEKLLNRLVRVLRVQDGETIPHPTAQAIEAYLLGNSTGNQEEEIRNALILSASFRREILGMASDIAALTEKLTIEKFHKISVDETPDYNRFLKQDDPAAKTHFVVSGIRAINRLLGRRSRSADRPAFSHYLRYATAGLALTATMVILYFGSVQFGDRNGINELAMGEWERGTTMDAGLFVSNTTRTSEKEQDIPIYSTSHLDAAEAEFMRLIRLEDGLWVIDSAGIGATNDRLSRQVYLRLIDDSEDCEHEFIANIPVREIERFPSIKAWILVIPSREIYSLDISTDSTVTQWNSTMDSTGYGIFTYEIDGKYEAVSGKAFRF